MKLFLLLYIVNIFTCVYHWQLFLSIRPSDDQRLCLHNNTQIFLILILSLGLFKIYCTNDINKTEHNLFLLHLALIKV
jgi:hypothetical protein